MEKKEKDWYSVNLDFYSSKHLKDLIGVSNLSISYNVCTFYTDYITLVNNFDEFIRIVKIMMGEGFHTVNVEDYRCVKFINDHLPEPLDIVVNILDDYDIKPRSNIVKAEIDKVKFTIPLSYIMWGIDFDDLMYVNLTAYRQNGLNYNGNKSISLDTLKRIKDIIAYLKSLGRFNDLQIIILVSNYLQKNTEYIAENVDKQGKYISVLDDPVEGIEDEVGLIETVLFKKFGLCTGIANATTVLLNNPTFNIDARTIFNKGHAFNLIKYNGKYYFLDNTWAITRSPREFPKAIKPVEFNPKYILYGRRSFLHLVDQSYLCDNPNIELVLDRGIKQSEILKAKRQMEDRISFKYPESIIHPVTKIKK